MGIESLVFFDSNEPDYDEGAVEASKCVKGAPVQRSWNHFTSGDGKMFAGIWAVEPGCWKVHYTENEFCQILEGHSVLRDESGAERPLKSGDNFCIPAGFRGEWEAIEPTRKIYVIYQP